MMKKLFSLVLVLFACFALFLGCASDPAKNSSATKLSDLDSAASKTEENDSQLSLLRELISGNDCDVGIAFIGYVDSESTQENLRKMLEGSRTGQKYPFLTDCPIVKNKGQELYAIVPAKKDACVTVFEAGVTQDGEYEDYRDHIVFRAEPGEPIILRCNLSEIYSNVLVSVDVPGKDRVEFRPCLSMMDGSIALEIGCYDFTVLEQQGAFSDYLYDMTGEWWSEPQKDKQGDPIYYRMKLEYSPDYEKNFFELAAGDSVYQNGYGVYWPADSKTDEYSYTIHIQEKDLNGKFLLTKNGNRLTVTESGGDRLFFLTDTKDLDFRFHPYPDLSGYDVSVRLSYEMLRVKDEIQYHVSHSGMELMYMNEQQTIHDERCMLFALGTNHDDQFVREFLYAVSDQGNIYSYDAVNDMWMTLGEG